MGIASLPDKVGYASPPRQRGDLHRRTQHEHLALSGQIDVIVVDIPDRLGRGDVIAKCELLAQLNGCRIEYARKGYDTSTVEGMASHAMEQLVSGRERLKIGERTANGKINLARGGRVISAPRRPYGYRAVNTYNERGTKIACTLEILRKRPRLSERCLRCVPEKVMW